MPNNKGYKNFATNGGPVTRCGYYDSDGKPVDIDGEACRYNPEKGSSNLCTYFYNNRVCKNPIAQMEARK